MSKKEELDKVVELVKKTILEAYEKCFTFSRSSDKQRQAITHMSSKHQTLFVLQQRINACIKLIEDEQNSLFLHSERAMS